MCEGKESSSTTELDELVLRLKKPVVFHGMIDDWDVLNLAPECWERILSEDPDLPTRSEEVQPPLLRLPFRSGVNKCSLKPVWEGDCIIEDMTLKEFVEIQDKTSADPGEGKRWHYFDYKRLYDWVPDGESLKSVNWGRFGFPEQEADDSSLWMGNTGAHTACHYDVYGINLVAQVYGTKRWILFPPTEFKNMNPTRIPYEESSVYSQWNFSCPLPSEFYTGLKEVYIVDLKPGDVLFVPYQWWHYVECLDVAVSINTWIATDLDDAGRLDEALVRLFMSQVSKGCDEDTRDTLLNPNERDINTRQMFYLTNMIANNFGVMLEQTKANEQRAESAIVEPPNKQRKLEDIDHSELPPALKKLNAEPVSSSSIEALKSLMDEKCNCPSKEKHLELMTPSSKGYANMLKIFDAFCHPDIIKQVREKLTESCDQY